MNHDQLVAAVALRLYRYSRKDVAEILDVFTEVCQAELIQPDGVIHIRGLGRLHVQEQEVSSRGAVESLLRDKGQPVPPTVKRYYFRFRPSDKFKQQLVSYRQEMEDQRHE